MMETQIRKLDYAAIDMDIIEAVSMKKKFNYELYETLQMISM